ncbi:hypothetical protein SAMN05421827_108175 [Pedobacter terrae]|uniref:Uncharacterized protein n=1 Tax=Pedobacter terrae TaxID=405671 RepID=A0A1G7VNT5_9SPHI|nr:hypothetical protein [Pedobacter terrae]SDG61485.1 hypothetical protein SAMN05421827_108175 [Pedobacter terrae]
MQENRPIDQQRLSQQRAPMVSRKSLLIVIVISLVLLSGLWIWKAVELGRVRSENDMAYKLLKRKVSVQMDSSLKSQLLLLSKPFVWAIRDKMISGNRQDINIYMNQMVKERHFEKISIVDQRNVILLSTDKKEEGKPYSTFYNDSFLKSDSTKMYTQSGRTIVITAPILGLDKRLGTLSIKYNMPNPTLD